MIAATPEPPLLMPLIFSSQRTAGDQGYGVMAERMVELARTQPGFLGVESARDADSFGITVSYLDGADEASIAAWKAHAEHAVAQRLGRERWYRRLPPTGLPCRTLVRGWGQTGLVLMLAWLAYLTVAVVWGSTYSPSPWAWSPSRPTAWWRPGFPWPR